MTTHKTRVVHVPALDTGLGREAGFENDQALIDHHNAEMAKLAPEVRAEVERLMADEVDAFVMGRGAVNDRERPDIATPRQ